MVPLGFPGGAVIKNPRANAGDTRDAGLISGSGKFPGNSKPLQYSCLEKIHRQKSPAGYSPWGRKESDMNEHTHTMTGMPQAL